MPPTLVSLAVDTITTDEVISPEFKQAGHKAVLLRCAVKEDKTVDFPQAMAMYDQVHAAMQAGRVYAAYAVTAGGVIEAVTKMAMGNGFGFCFCEDAGKALAEAPLYGSLVVETDDEALLELGQVLGSICETAGFTLGEESVSLADVEAAYTAPLEKVYKTQTPLSDQMGDAPLFNPAEKRIHVGSRADAKPRVFIPVFPGTNCEYDTARAFAMAGAQPDVFVFRNLTPADINASIAEMVKRLQQAQILMVSGGFSAGDEPEGSGKFIATVFSNQQIQEATMELLQQRDGLALGICNGFQALIKLGLVPYGEIRPLKAEAPTLTYNTIGRHASCMVRTRVTSTLSPWLSSSQAGDIHTIAISHGEGRFVASDAMLRQLAANGQIATQYVDADGQPTMDIAYNPNGSLWGIEGITSPDGRVLGKMGHSERIGENVAKNIPGVKDQQIFRNGVQYFL